MSKQLHFQFIINPISGIRQKMGIVEDLKKCLSPEISYGTTFTERADHATEIALEAVANGVDAVVAVGGDGSVNEVGKALINTKVALGIIPCGSGNGFARHLKIPLQVKKAIERLNDFNTRTIDTGLVNNEPFLATTGLGFDAHIGQKFAAFGKRGFLSYLQVTANEFLNFKSKKYTLEIDGEKLEINAFLINFANSGQYGNNAWIAPTASVSDGKLEVCILEEFPAHNAPDIIFKLFSKQIINSNYYKVSQAKEIKVFDVENYHLDGEPRHFKGDLLIKVVPSSLKVIS
ncbi:MAG: YegS/Rv2252/BmrU family lipid kinase [Vicingaceae bacterium]